MKSAGWTGIAACALMVSLLIWPSAASAVALGPGSPCYWGDYYSLSGGTNPDGHYKLGCVATDPVKAANCVQLINRLPASMTFCNPNATHPTQMYDCYTNYDHSSPPVCMPGSSDCTTRNDYILPYPLAWSPIYECNTTCSTGYIDMYGSCTNPPPAVDPGSTGPADDKMCNAGGNALLSAEQPTGPLAQGMCAANAHLMQINLNISDTPVGYKPPLGPAAYLRLTYNHREASQPTTFAYFNVGPKWNLNILSYVTDDPATPGSRVVRNEADGGYIDYSHIPGLYYATSTGVFTGEPQTSGMLVRIPATGAATSYELRFPDGTKHVYGKLDGASTYPRRVFLTQIVDPQGNALTFTYDSSLRVTTLTDAAARATTLSYTNTNPLLVTKITDPFGRYATLAYDGSGRLSSITDVVGIVSSFTYDTTDPTLIKTLTTPYGARNFAFGQSATVDQRWLELTDPLGNTRRVEYLSDPAGTPLSPANVPSGVNSGGGNYKLANSYVWDEHQYPLAITKSGGVVTAEDYTKAQMTHWLTDGTGVVVSTPGGTKQPLENTVYYNYPWQANALQQGSFNTPTAFGRKLDDGSSQVTAASYNALGNPGTTTDPKSRITYFGYGSNNIDLTYRWLGGIYYAQYGSYNSLHEPGTYTDAAGQVTNYAYNTAGQKIYETNPLGQTRFWEYDSYGRKTRITVPVAVAFGSVVYGTTNTTSPTAMAYTYDSYDRIRTKTDSEGRVLTYDYDALDRVTKITYPDTSHDDYDWNFQSGTYVGTASLDIRKVTNRLGRVTTFDYDANRRVTSVTETIDSTHTRTTSYAYWENGVLKSITDANGGVTRFDIDLQGRRTVKTYAYGTAGAKSETTAYETTTSRIKTLTDALSQVKTYAYALDDQITGITYTGAINTTPNVTIAWDTSFPRMTSMTDGTGTTNFTYIAGSTNGAMKVATIDNSTFSNDTITYTYNALGRISTKTISGGNESYTYDTLGRVATHTTGLGTFTYGYLGNTGQIASRTLNGTSIGTSWAYDTNTNDRKLTGITNSGVTRSYTFTYANNAFISGAKNPYDIGGITDTAAATHPYASQTWADAFDWVHRLLTSASSSYSFTYGNDPADNLTSIAGAAAGNGTFTYDAFNRRTGTNPPVYDFNGNVTDDYARLQQKWDAENRLVEADYKTAAGASTYTAQKSQFVYDNKNQRIVDTETPASGSAVVTRNLWCEDGTLCQQRNGSDTVLKRYYLEGEDNIATGQKLVYMPDQLGSVRDAINATTGVLAYAADYEPYGNTIRSTLIGTATAPDYRYAAMIYHQQLQQYLTQYRAYNPAAPRWNSRDPIGEIANGRFNNPYGYGASNPIMNTDPDGYKAIPIPGAGIGLPIYFPPIAIPGSKENGDWVKWGQQNVIRPIGDWWDNVCQMAKPSDKDKSTDYPSWVNSYGRDPNESCKDFARSVLDDKYGPGNWIDGPGSEYSKIVKACQRGGLK